MRNTRSLSVDVSELLRQPGTSRRLTFDAPVEGMSVQLAEVEQGSEVHGDLRLDSLVEGIHVGGELAGRIVTRCRRCLRDVPQQVHVRVNELFMGDAEEAELADAYAIQHDERVDLDTMIRDLLLLELPLNPLCREGCKGLCPVCGADRNDTDCGHSAEPVDVRWDALGQLRDKMEG